MGVGSLRRAVFFDRDGVLNKARIVEGRPYPPASLADLEVEADAPLLLRQLKERSFVLIVVTNQPDVGRGSQAIEEVEAIHEALNAALPLDDVFVCYHADDSACDCRKPKPGMLFAAAQQHDIDLSQSFLVGDRWRDIDAARAAGVRAIWLDRAYAERGPTSPADATVASLEEAIAWILANSALPSMADFVSKETRQ